MSFARFALRYVAWLGAACAALLAIFFAYPILHEGVTGSCEAYGARVAAINGVGATGANGKLALLAGPAAEIGVRQSHPDIPPLLACTGLYWDSLIEPDAYNP